MSEQEQRDWAQMMGVTLSQQADTIAGLLRHANEDHMSFDDRVICRRQLTRLKFEIARASYGRAG